MVTREDVISRIRADRVIAIVRGFGKSDCLKLAEAFCAGGLKLVEFTFNQSNKSSWQETAEIISAVREAMEGKLFVGAGTVCSVELVELAHSAGAGFIISPDADEAVIRRTRELGLVSIPGALTPTEIKAAYNAGADFVKVFPASAMGPAYIKAVRAPLSHIPLLAVGGVSEKNIADYVKAGACGAGCGGNLVNKEWVKNGEFEKITAAAREYLAAAAI